MKVLIWQQFSSNHSSSFTVVGEFATRAEAERAADEIRAMLDKITRWCNAHPAECAQIQAEHEELSPPEKELAAQYNIEWLYPIDWFAYPKIDIVLDRLIFITHYHRPEADGQPFDQIINRLGGKGYHDGDVYATPTGWILFDLTCDAPDEMTASTLIDKHIGFNRRIKRNGSHLHFDRWRFDEKPALPELIEELQRLGCTSIGYTFQQVDPDVPIEQLQIHTSEDVEVLIEVLAKTKDEEDIEHTAFALGNFGDVRAVEPLISALQSPSGKVRSSVVSALGKLRDPRAVEPLISLLPRDDRLSRNYILGALGNIGGERAVATLIRYLSDDHLWEVAARILGLLGESALQPLEDAHTASSGELQTRTEAALRYVRATISGGEQLAALRSPDEKTRRAAFEQVKQMQDVDLMLAYLKDPGLVYDFQLQQEMINFVIDMRDWRVIDALVNRLALLDHRAIMIMAKIGAPAVDALLGLYRNYSEQWIRETTLNTLARIGDLRAFDLFNEILKTGNPMSMWAAAAGLEKIGDPRAIQPLIHALFQHGHRHSQLWSSVIQAIKALNGQSELVEALIERLPDQSSSTMSELLAELGDQRAIPPLLNLLPSADTHIAATIRSALQKLGYSEDKP